VSNFVKSTDFAVKDGLLTGDPAKIIKGTEIDTEFNNIATAISTKADLASPTFTGTPAAPTASPGTNTTQVATTAFTTAAVTAATGALGTMATQAASSVAITGGSITGITDLTVADGGTGASSITANSVILGNGSSALSGNLVAPGTLGNLLTSDGTTWTSAAPVIPPGVGISQTWQDVTGSRTPGTTYTNSTGKPIQVIAQFRSSSQTNFATGTINGIAMKGTTTTSSAHWSTITYIVPNGNTYSADMTSIVETIWLELR
jgi:hypothetical protein